MSGCNEYLLSAAAAVALAASAPAVTYHVNGTCGNDAWSGTSPDCAAPDGPKATIQAALVAAAVEGDEIVVWPGTYGELIDFLGKAVVLRSDAGASVTVIDGQGAGRVVTCASGEAPDTVLEGFTIAGGAHDFAAGMVNDGSSPTIRHCVFTDNNADMAGAIRNYHGASPLIEGCSFIDNSAQAGAAAVVNTEGHPVFRDCLFLENDDADVGAVVNTDSADGSPQFINCRFFQNTGLAFSGGVMDGSGARFVNCVLSRTTSGDFDSPGALAFVGSEPSIIGCTVGGNACPGLSSDFANIQEIRNSIFWGNDGGSWISPSWDVTSSNIEGGHPGSGNIDADPLFVQPGTDNLRLAEGSPCINAGDNSAVPPDVPSDVDGLPRIQDGVVDMGAYEGGFEPQPAAAGAGDFDNGEFVVLVPSGGPLDPPQTAAAIVVNHSGPDDATFVVTERWEELHPGAGGYSELGIILTIETSLADGEFIATLFIPMEFDGPDTVNRLHVNLTRYDADAGNWSLAVAGNTTDSPGFDGPIGNRVVELFGDWGVTQEIGDYGISMDLDAERAFAWANVDTAQDFALGVALCPADCLQTPDGEVGVQDFLAMLARWGDAAGGGPCDVDYDGVIGPDDFLALLDVWGACGRAAHPAAAPASGRVGISRSADIDHDGSVGLSDVSALKASWGPCGPDCAADLNADGRVDARDYLALVARWR
jgi:hypothetical protein